MASRCGKVKHIMKKNIFLSVMAIVAIAGAVVFSAFKADVHKQVRAIQWFEYDGIGDPELASSYDAVGSTSPGCSGTNEVCSIQAQESADPNEPEMDETLINEIRAALANPSTPQAHVELRN